MTRIRIIVDTDAESPREWSNIGTMACWHRRYTLGDEQPKVDPQEYQADLPKGTIILPLYLYDHSGITISTTGFSCPWDSGQVGFIYATPDTIRREMEVKAITRKVREKVTGILQSEVKVYAQYLEGEVYGFVIEEGEACDHGEVHWEQTDSCWGFLGSNPMENGMSEHVPETLHAQLQEAARSPEYR